MKVKFGLAITLCLLTALAMLALQPPASAQEEGVMYYAAIDESGTLYLHVMFGGVQALDPYAPALESVEEFALATQGYEEVSGVPLPIAQAGFMIAKYPTTISKATSDSLVEQLASYLESTFPGLSLEFYFYSETSGERVYMYTCGMQQMSIIDNIERLVEGTQLEQVFTHSLLEDLASRGQLTMVVSGGRYEGELQIIGLVGYVEAAYYQGEGEFRFSLLDLLGQTSLPGPATMSLVLPSDCVVSDVQVEGEDVVQQSYGSIIQVVWSVLDKMEVTFQYSFQQAIEPPQVTIVSPSHGATVGGLITIEADVVGEQISEVRFEVDGEVVDVKQSPPWSIMYDTSQLQPGEHTIRVVATNPGGSNYDEITIVIPQVQPPTVTITSPQPGATVSGVVTITAVVQGQQIEKVEFYVDNQLLVTRTSPPWTHTWDTSTVSSGPHTIRVVAYNPGGTDEATITVNVQAGGGGGAPPSKCVIATAAYGSELAPEVQFLRAFRDGYVMSTFAGRCFMETFNAFYYSWSPGVAAYISGSSILKDLTKAVIYPLIWSLEVSREVFTALSFNPEFAVVATGLVASALIGLIYVAPIATVASLLLKRRLKVSGLKVLRVIALAWLTAIGLLAIAEGALSEGLMVFSSSALVLTTIALASACAAWLLVKGFTHLGRRLLPQG